ncbi:MAG: hypothetical protein D6820_11155 [Lentisphaerae bacterium]|nr:MAG: hypothetical protein D6820_11155 [Lentisphaerota bacterium]
MTGSLIRNALYNIALLFTTLVALTGNGAFAQEEKAPGTQEMVKRYPHLELLFRTKLNAEKTHQFLMKLDQFFPDFTRMWEQRIAQLAPDQQALQKLLNKFRDEDDEEDENFGDGDKENGDEDEDEDEDWEEEENLERALEVLEEAKDQFTDLYEFFQEYHELLEEEPDEAEELLRTKRYEVDIARLSFRIRSLAAKNPQDPALGNLKKQLRNLLELLFDAKLKSLEREFRELDHEHKQLRHLLEQRRKLRDKIIEQKFLRLIEGDEVMEF